VEWYWQSQSEEFGQPGAKSRGVTKITWKSHCVQVVIAQHLAFRCRGNIQEIYVSTIRNIVEDNQYTSLQTFHEIGPSDTPKKKAKV
jgi:hypothetical protein